MLSMGSRASFWYVKHLPQHTSRRSAIRANIFQSNHGGRQADYAPAPIDVLYEIRVLKPELFNKIEIIVDGGFRSGADVVKALALGAKAVGLGRPFLYANGTHGEEGVSRVLQSGFSPNYDQREL